MADKPKRDPATVIKAARDAVPKKCAELRKTLTKIADDAWFQPPESSTPWENLRDTLTGYIGEPREEWHFKVIEIVKSHPGIPEA
jgi:hypothetical protein